VIELNWSTKTPLQRRFAQQSAVSLTDREEGMGIAVEDYCACWIEITVDEPSDMDAKQVVLLGTDFQYRLNGRPVTLRKRQD
jgi:hypothetical protein